ncbi:hypothetical protein [Aliiglaciecola litoralis]|uniref:Prephenate dehydrogenase n=1 Tax=Aliiglaciecola litoralis TaxID=582857 RepID=A0ABP3WQL6_9ALTE
MSTISDAAKRALFEKLAENMQLIYRKAIDADDVLAKLQQSGKGKFQNVFTQDAGFTVQSKRFMPYVKELAGQVVELEQEQDEELQIKLAEIVKKMELLLSTLNQFKSSV